MVNAEKIRSLMTERGVTGKELAEKADIGEGLMSRIANGLRAPSVEVLVRIAAELDCTVDELIVKK